MNAEVVVVGGGTAGAAVAWQCARRGLDVLVLERAELQDAGARWVNGVPAWAFDAAGLARPRAPECLAAGVPFHMRAGFTSQGVTLRDHDLLEVDMRALGARLIRMARRAGARFERARVQSWDGRTLETDRGAVRVERVAVDASGLTGARLLDQDPVAPSDLCVAAQHVRDVRDVQAAQAFFHGHGVPPGELLCFTGVAGGYSIINVRLDGDELAILTGSVPAEGHPSGKVLLDRFAHDHPWVGDARFGGHRALPLCGPLSCVGVERTVAVGDAARMVHPAHGSGIAQQLLASWLLGEVLGRGGTPWDFNTRWQRSRAGALAGAEVFRRFTQTLSVDQVGELMASGVMGPGISRRTLTQRRPRPERADLRGMVAGLSRSPSVLGQLGPVLARMQAVEAHHALYPSTPRGLARWERVRARLR